MNRQSKWGVTVAGFALCGALFAGQALAANELPGIQGFEAQALSAEEMQAISGKLNAYDIAAALTATAVQLGSYPRLQESLLKLASYYETNATQINAAFQKLGIYTTCRTCTTP